MDISNLTYDKATNTITAEGGKAYFYLNMYGRNIDRLRNIVTHDEIEIGSGHRRGDDDNVDYMRVGWVEVSASPCSDSALVYDNIYVKIDGCDTIMPCPNFPKIVVKQVSKDEKKLCGIMCDNEFAVKTMKLRGQGIYNDCYLEVRFWNEKDGDYTAVASTENGDIVIEEVYNNDTYNYDAVAVVTIPKNAGENHPILVKNNFSEVYSDFIYRDKRNLLITMDDKEYLNKFIESRPEVSVYKGEETSRLEEDRDEIANKYFKSQNTNGDFAIFHSDDFISLTYNLANPNNNSEKVMPKHPTVFGSFGNDILEGKYNPSDFVIKFEVFVSDYLPMRGQDILIGFYNTIDEEYEMSEEFEARQYCAVWQPSKINFTKKMDNYWLINSADKWTSGGDWMTVAIPMDEILYNFWMGSYGTDAATDRVYDGSYEYFGDSEAGLPYFAKNKDWKAMFDAKTYKDLKDGCLTGITFIMDYYDYAVYTGDKVYIGIDNVRIVPKDNNGGMWKMLKWGVPEREFYTAPLKCEK